MIKYLYWTLYGGMPMQWYYIAIIVILIACLLGGLIFLRTRTAKKTIRHVKAKLERTETERSEFEAPDGKVYSKITAMVLVFLVEDGTELRFAVDSKMKGRVQEQQWGYLMYCGDQLLKFECQNGKIGAKRYLNDGILKSKYFRS